MPDSITTQRSRNEFIKEGSNFLRGTIAEGLLDQITGGLAEDDQQLTKFHGIYQQDDRDLRAERGEEELEKAFSFMARLRVPGGVLTPAQWLAMDDLAAERGNGTLRLTTRQTIQFHGIIKSNLRPAIQAIHAALLDTIAACGDVNRNVIASTDAAGARGACRDRRRWPTRSATICCRTSRAWHEIWIDGDAGRRRRGGGRADLRPHLPAAEVQDRHRGAAAERRRCVRARHRLHRDPAGRRGSSATTWRPAAAWA